VQRIGEEVSETLEYTPAKLEVLQHVRLKYRCDADDGSSAVLTAIAQASPLPKCQAGASLLAHVVVSKYNEHWPLARRGASASSSARGCVCRARRSATGRWGPRSCCSG
jgi:transposase